LISATKKDIIQKNVASFAENKPKVKRKQVDVWDEVEVKCFLEFVSQANTRYYMAFHLAIATGMRQGEILGIRWKDIDFDRRLISVKQSLSHDGKEFGPPKTETSIRSISLDEKTLKLLKQKRDAVLEEKISLITITWISI
jgi:integrase